MGWFTKLLFGTDNQMKSSDEMLPKSVEEWEDTAGQQPHGASTQMPGVTPAEPRNLYRDASGSKVIPEIEVARVEPHLSGDERHIEVWITAKNKSTLDVELTRIECLGQHVDPDRFLKAGESHEIKVFAGDTPHNHGYDKAYIDYKIVGNGDYFRAEFLVEYHYEHNDRGEFYIPKEFRRVGAIRDI